MTLILRLTVVLCTALAACGAAATEAGWARLRDGEHVVLFRHAVTPGAAEPAGFVVDDCSTQRNLSDRGRQQARKMGALLAARAAPFERVLSSRYCRALETARLAFGEKALESFEALDLLSSHGDKAKLQNEAVLREIQAWSGSGNLALVTHGENIKALTGVDAREGEAVIVETGAGGLLHVLARIAFN